MTTDKTGTEIDNSFTSLSTYQFVLLKTFRKSGVAVPTVVWFAIDNGKLYLMTVNNVGKVKRIRNSGHVLLAPCDRGGKVLGTEVEGHARELPASEHAHASAILARKYGFLYRAFMFFGKLRNTKQTYIEIVPAVMN
jgi:PPOX class probable F420-dependent enzyme